MTFIRASEMCGTRAWFLDNGTPPSPRETQLSKYRMGLGVASEALSIARLRADGHVIVPHDQSVKYAYQGARHAMAGTPDTYLIPDATDGAPAQVLEMKQTSASNYAKVVRGLRDGNFDDRAGTLGWYRKQGRRYAALTSLNELVVRSEIGDHPIDPTSLWVNVTNRDSCETLVEPIKAFDMPWDDFRKALDDDMDDALGDGSKEPPKPSWANSHHPKCQTCDFAYKCWWNHRPDRADADYQEFGKRWATLDADARVHTEGAKEVKRLRDELRSELSDKLKSDGLDRMDIGGFTASFGKTTVRFLADQDMMRADGVHGKYNKNRDVKAGEQLNIRKGGSK